jgi:HdeA/HdeB family
MRHGEAEGLGGLEIDDEIEFGGLFDRDIARLRPTKNPVDKFCGTPEKSRKVRSVGHETSSSHRIGAVQNRRQARADRKRGYSRAVDDNESIFHDVKCVRLTLESVENGSNILRSPDLVWSDFETERASRALDLTHFLVGCGIAGIAQVIIDMGAFTCDQYLAMSPTMSRDFSAWMSGWFSNHAGRRVVDVLAHQKNIAILKSWCQSHPQVSVMAALQSAIGPQ